MLAWKQPPNRAEPDRCAEPWTRVTGIYAGGDPATFEREKFMNWLSTSRTVLCLLVCLAWLAACSGEDPGSLPEPASEPDPEPSTEVPTVVVLPSEQLVPWLESEGWWGTVNSENQATVPHVLITRIRPSWRENANTLPVDVKKGLFYRLMLPLVMHANKMALDFREGLLTAQTEWQTDGLISVESLVLLRRLAPLLPGMTVEDSQTLTAGDPKMGEMLDTLIYRVDAVPAGLALGQAAYESGYGTSRFAVEGNSLFGQWTYTGDGIKPEQQRRESKGDHRIKAFEWPFDSVRGYFVNLMTHPAYEDFRRLRAEMRSAGEPLESLRLANGLLRYSERGEAYVDSLKGIIRHNKLHMADGLRFRDEPIRFLLIGEDEAEVAAIERAIAEATNSGELAEIYQRMKLD